MQKKVLAFLLAAIMILAVAAVPVLATESSNTGSPTNLSESETILWIIVAACAVLVIIIISVLVTKKKN